MRLVYSSDIHGQTSHYEELFELATRESARAVVLGGDLLPPPRGLSSPAGREDAKKRQAEYLLSELMPRLENARSLGMAVLMLLGNYDLGAVSGEFERISNARGMLTLHEKAHQVEGLVFAGLSWVNHTPFPLKDWETWDLSRGNMHPGAVSHEDPRAILTWERRDGFTPFAESLEVLSRSVSGMEGDRIYVLHAPPYATGLDTISRKGDPVGSRAVRRFIEDRQPRLTFHGHIHEAPHISGHWGAALGKTISFQPGQSTERLHAIVIDTADPAGARHTVFGNLDLEKATEAGALGAA